LRKDEISMQRGDDFVDTCADRDFAVIMPTCAPIIIEGVLLMLDGRANVQPLFQLSDFGAYFSAV